MKLKKSENGLGVTFEPAATRRHSLALIDLLDNFMRSKNALFKTNVKKKAQPPNFKMRQAYILHTGTLLTYI